MKQPQQHRAAFTERVTVRLTPELYQELDAKTEPGGDRTLSDVLRDAAHQYLNGDNSEQE